MCAFFGWDVAETGVVGDVVAFPVFEEEWCGWDAGVADGGVLVEWVCLLVEVGEDAFLVCVLEVMFEGLWVVVAEDDEEFGCGGALFHGFEKVAGQECVDGDGGVVDGEEVSAKEDGVRVFVVDSVVQCVVAGGAAVEV